MKSKYFLTLVRMQAGTELVARKFECSRQYRGQLPRTRPRTDSPRPRPRPRTDSPRPRPRTWNPRRRPRTDCLSEAKAKDWQSKARTKNLKPKTKDVVNWPRRYSTLIKAVSLRTPYLMSIKGVLRTVHCLQYCTVLYTTSSMIKNYDWRIGGVLGPPGPPLGYAHDWRRRRPLSATRLMSSAKKAGAKPGIDWCARHAIL